MYQGQELQEGLNTYLTEFRMYDPALGRLWQIDPIDKEDQTPYAWALNNPILYIDYLGLDTLNSNDANFNWDDVNPGDVVDDAVVLDEVVVEGEDESAEIVEATENSPNVRYAKEQLDFENRPLASGAVSEIYPIYDLITLPRSGTKLLFKGATKAVGARKGSNKNSKHASQSRRDAAKKKYEDAKNEYEELKRTPNKTPEVKKKMERARKKMESEKRNMDFTGENHSQKSKGN